MKGRFGFIPPVIVNRNNDYRHQIGTAQNKSNGHGLFIKKRSSHSTHKNKRHKNGAGCENGAEHRSHHLPCSLKDGIPKILFPLPSGRDIVYEDNGIICHHPHAKQETRERDDVQGQADKTEQQHGKYQGGWHGQKYQSRIPDIFQEEKDYDTCQQYTQNNIIEQIPDGKSQKRCLIAGKLERQLRVILLELVQKVSDGLFEARHPGLALFNHRQRHRRFSVRADSTRALDARYGDIGQVSHLQKPVATFEPDGSDIFRAAYTGIKLHLIAIGTVADC